MPRYLQILTSAAAQLEAAAVRRSGRPACNLRIALVFTPLQPGGSYEILGIRALWGE